MQLRKHQQRFLDQNPDKALLCWDCRTGKTLPASIWGKNRGTRGVIVCPKQGVEDWKRHSPEALVLSKEQFKKLSRGIENPTSLIIDECHTTASGLFLKGRSQLSTAVYNLVKKYPDMPVLLLSATPITNNPASLHTLLCYIGKYIPWDKWRERFYTLERRPYLPRPAWFPKAGWQKDIRTVLEKYADIVSLKDCIDYLPPVTKDIIKIKTPKYIKDMAEAPWTHEHLHEQSKKPEYIKTMRYRKIIVACHYTAQIDEMEKELSKVRQTFVLDGRTKKPDDVKRMAQEADECYFICQASMMYGWDGFSFGCLVFASMSHKCLDHYQALGRMINVDDPKPIFYEYLIGGRWDKKIYDSIQLGNDFNPHLI